MDFVLSNVKHVGLGKVLITINSRSIHSIGVSVLVGHSMESIDT